MNAHLSKQELLEKLRENELLIQLLVRQLLKLQQERRNQKYANNDLRDQVERLTPEKCPDCDEVTLVTNHLIDGQTTGSKRICYNCGWERG